MVVVVMVVVVVVLVVVGGGGGGGCVSVGGISGGVHVSDQQNALLKIIDK